MFNDKKVQEFVIEIVILLLQSVILNDHLIFHFYVAEIYFDNFFLLIAVLRKSFNNVRIQRNDFTEDI